MTGSRLVELLLSISNVLLVISRYSNNRIVLAPQGMRELRTHLFFTQLRFHCSKQQGRTLHVTTAADNTGEAVVQFFSRQTDVKPYACGLLERLKGDNSVLAINCTKWEKGAGSYYAGKWGHGGVSELYIFPVFIINFCHWTTWTDADRWECDDEEKSVSSGDLWKIYFR